MGFKNKIKKRCKKIEGKRRHILMYRTNIKGKLDRIIALIAIIVLLPVLLILSIIIKLTSKGPVFFKQKRVGIYKTYFYIWKFRTMRIDTPKDVPTHLFSNPEQFITPVGGFLRKTSLDELPQLFNIAAGQMAIVGPRPALWNQYDLIEKREKYGANDILPGLTGLAQINGRDEIEISKKAKLDGIYVKKISFLFDIFIIIKTVFRVLERDGVKEGSINRK